MTASLTGLSLRSGDKPLACAAYLKTNSMLKPLGSVNEKEIDFSIGEVANTAQHRRRSPQ